MTTDSSRTPTNTTDHRAEAERRIGWAAGNEEAKWAMVNATIGLVHATLAAGTPIADQHLYEALIKQRGMWAGAVNDLTKLRQAVRDYVAHVEDGARFARMADLAGSAR